SAASCRSSAAAGVGCPVPGVEQVCDLVDVGVDADARQKRDRADDRLSLGTVNLRRRDDEIVVADLGRDLGCLALVDAYGDASGAKALLELLRDDRRSSDPGSAGHEDLLHASRLSPKRFVG